MQWKQLFEFQDIRVTYFFSISGSFFYSFIILNWETSLSLAAKTNSISTLPDFPTTLYIDKCTQSQGHQHCFDSGVGRGKTNRKIHKTVRSCKDCYFPRNLERLCTTFTCQIRNGTPPFWGSAASPCANALGSAKPSVTWWARSFTIKYLMVFVLND